MAVVVVKSAQITNRDATPPALQDPRLAGTEIRGASGVVAITSGDNVGSTYIALSMPAKALPRSLTISAPDIGTTTTADVGLYRTTKNGSTVIDADFFTAAFVLNAGAVNKSSVLNGNIITVALSETILKNHVGPATYSTDDKYDVVLTLAGIADGSGAVLVEASWAEG